MKTGLIFAAALAIGATLLVGCSVPESPTLNSTPDNIESETAPALASTEMSDLPAGMGMLKFYVTDPPPPDMDEIWVDVRSLEVHKSGGEWTTVAEDPGEFDLKAIEEIQQYLASQIVEAGRYTQIRLEVYSVRIVVGEDEYYAKVPSEKIKLVGTFEVTENNTTEITLDFIGAESVLVTGKGDYIFRPVIKLLVEHPSSEAPTVTSVDPISGDQGETLDVTITGTDLNGATEVSFGDGITINSYTVDSDTQVTANITVAGDATPGTRDVSVTTPEGTGTLTDGFAVTVPAPTVTSVDPISGDQGETLDVTIAGTGLNGATGVSFGDGITINSYAVDSDTQVTANITVAGDATPDTRDVSVTTPEGTGTLTDGFAVTAPAP